MKIITSVANNFQILTEYFDFNQVPYDIVDLWDPTSMCYNITHKSLEENNLLLILNHDLLHEILQIDDSRSRLIQFAQNNKLWIWNDMDGLLTSLSNLKILLDLDNKVPKGSVTLFVDGELIPQHPLTHLCNIQCKVIPINFFFRSPRINNGIILKKNCSKDFILTTIKKPGRSHRDILWNQLNAVPGLLNRGYVKYGSGSKRIGRQPHQHNWPDGHPSMDLYLDSWLELVPETLYNDGYFFTEKTAKPIATKTPFLIISTCGYLEYLRKFGFKTFHDIIDESYDQEPDVNIRIKLVIEQLCNIIKIGPELFYQDCGQILEHNQNKLFELSSKRQFVVDLFIAENLAQIGFVQK